MEPDIGLADAIRAAFGADAKIAWNCGNPSMTIRGPDWGFGGDGDWTVCVGAYRHYGKPQMMVSSVPPLRVGNGMVRVSDPVALVALGEAIQSAVDSPEIHPAVAEVFRAAQCRIIAALAGDAA